MSTVAAIIETPRLQFHAIHGWCCYYSLGGAENGVGYVHVSR